VRTGHGHHLYPEQGRFTHHRRGRSAETPGPGGRGERLASLAVPFEEDSKVHSLGGRQRGLAG
jgi:hypothetical protein